MTFEDLRLAEPILRAIIAEGYSVPTPIQAKAIPPVMEGHDLLGCAQTGTGKTAAFALPILHRLSQRQPVATPPPAAPAQPAASQAQVHAPRHGTQHGRAWTPSNKPHASQLTPRATAARPIRSLILAPTRELAAQIGDSFRAYGRNSGLRFTVIFGGVGQHPQTRALRDGVDIVIATPGRLLDLMNQGYVDLRAIEIFVLDEADRMLDMGFIHDIRKIAAKLPPVDKRQTLMFSATMPYDIRELASSLLRNPVNIEVAAVSATADRIDQCVYHVDRRNKPLLLTHIIQNTPITRAIIFTRTKHGADRLAKQLNQSEIHAEAIHGNKSQNARVRTLNNFRSGKSPILIASDIAARGIDIDDISHVFNYDLPDVPETYVHRIGRTARAGASGVAIAFCDPEERSNLRAIERLTKVNIPVKDDQPKFAARAESHEGDRSHRDDRRPPRDRRDGHRQRDDRRHDAPRHGGQSHRTAHAPQGGGVQRSGNSQPQPQSHRVSHSHAPASSAHAPKPAYRSASPSHHAPARPAHTSHATPQHAGQQGGGHSSHAAKPHHASAHSQGKAATPQHHAGKPAHQQHGAKPAQTHQPRDGQHAQHSQHPRPAQHAPHASKHPHQGKPAHYNKPAQHGQRPQGGKPHAKKH